MKKLFIGIIIGFLLAVGINFYRVWSIPLPQGFCEAYKQDMFWDWRWFRFNKTWTCVH